MIMTCMHILSKKTVYALVLGMLLILNDRNWPHTLAYLKWVYLRVLLLYVGYYQSLPLNCPKAYFWRTNPSCESHPNCYGCCYQQSTHPKEPSVSYPLSYNCRYFHKYNTFYIRIICKNSICPFYPGFDENSTKI